MKTWQQSNWKHQAIIITQLCRVLQSISEEEAQALPLKDPETGGLHDKLCSMCHACVTCCSVRTRNPSLGVLGLHRLSFRPMRQA